MTGFCSRGLRVVAALAALIVLGGQSRAADTSFQRIADEAALAAVQTLAANTGLDPATRRAEAVKAARKLITQIPGVAVEIDASVADMTAVVKLSVAGINKPAVGLARYIASEQPTVFAWATRQHFAFKPSPVVVGSRCPQGCDPVR